MESSFFSGSENLYKYLVSIGILMLVLTIYYPLKEKQNLEILKAQLLSELKIIEYAVDQNEKEAIFLRNKVSRKNLNVGQKNAALNEIKKVQVDNELNKIKADAKIQEIEIRRNYIKYYNIIIWLFAPLGFFLIFYVFINWRKSRINEDLKSKIEKDLLDLKLEKETRETQISK